MASEESLEYPSQHVVTCEGCGSTVSVNWFCKNCPGSMCDNCKANHLTSGFTKKHLVVPRTGKVVRTHGPAKIAEECRVHAGKEISTYCNDCKVACCVSCQVENHKRHDISLIEDKYLAAEKRLNDYTKELETNVKSKLKDMKSQVQTEVAKASQCSRDAEAEVNLFRRELKQAVDEGCDSIIQNLKKPNNDLDSIERDIDSSIQNVDVLVDKIGVRVREGKLSLIEYSPPSPYSLIPTITIPSPPPAHFIPNRKMLDIIKTQIGSIDSVRGKTSGNTNPSLDVSSRPIFEMSHFGVQKVTSFKSEIGTSSMATSGKNEVWIVNYAKDTMYLYNIYGKVVRSQTVHKGSGIRDLAIKSSGEIIVSNEDKKVRSVSSNGNISMLIDTSPYNPCGVCVTKEDEIVVCKRDDDYKDHCVAVYSSDGRKILREIRCQDDQGRQLFTDPYRVVQNGEDLCLVNGGSNVVCVDERGDVKWVYDGTQAKLEWSFNPSGICRDKYHNLLVTDLNNQCVHYIDMEGQLIQIILTLEQTGLMCPWGVSVDDETGQVWVGNDVRDFVIVKYLN